MVSAPDGSIYVGQRQRRPGLPDRLDRQGDRCSSTPKSSRCTRSRSAPGGGLYVGTSPDGKIYKVDATGKGTRASSIPPTSTSGASPSIKAGNVFAATGDKGVIYKITPDGKGAPFYQTKATHAMTLAFDRDGPLLAGTESPGPRVPDRRVGQAVRAARLELQRDPHAARRSRTASSTRRRSAAAAGGGTAAPPPAPRRRPPPAHRRRGLDRNHRRSPSSIAVVADVAAARRRHRTRRAPAAGARLPDQPDGAWDLIWESREDTPYDIAFERRRRVLVATGNKGKIYRLVGRSAAADAGHARQRAAGHDAPAAIATDACCSRRRTRARCSGCRRRAPSAAPTRPTSATRRRWPPWGAIKWQALIPAGTRLEISTRSGNTRTPDETWSDWSAAVHRPEGSAITSPRARYLQWRAVLIGGAQ